MPEITDEEFNAAKRAVQILQQLSTNPEARTDFERSLKKLDPKIRTREDEAAELTKPYADQLAALQARLDARDEADKKAEEDRASNESMMKLTEGFGRLKQAGLTTEGEEAVKQIMLDRNIPDPEAAFALFERQNPKPVSENSAWTPEHWKYDTDSVVDTALLFKNPDRWEDETIGQVLMEERRRPGGDY